MLAIGQRFSFKFIVYHHTMTEHKNNHVTMNFTMIMSQFAYQLWTHIGKIFFEAARTSYQSYRASLILAYSDVRGGGGGALLVCTLLSGALDSYRDRINSLLVSIWVFPQHISQSSGIYSRIPANTPDNFNLLFFIFF